VTAHPGAAAVVSNLIVALGCWGLGELTLAPISTQGPVSPIWPASGLAVAAAWLFGFRVLPGIYLGSVLLFGFRQAFPMALAASVGSVLEAFIDVRIMKALRFDDRLERTRDVLTLVFAVAPAGGLASATVGNLALVSFGARPMAELPYDWVLWWMRDWLGVVVVASLILTMVRPRPIAWTWRRTLEGLGVLLALFVTSQLMWDLWARFEHRNVPAAFVFFPIVGFAGIRFGARGAALLVAGASVSAILIAARSLGPFAEYPIQLTHFLLFLYLSLGALSGLYLAALMAERDDAMQRRLVLEEQLRHSQKMEAVGRLAGGIAHDFNNLLTAIIGYTEIVLTSLDPKDERRADAEEIGRAAMRAADLTRQMLAFSRKQVLQPKIMDLNVALTKVEPMVRRVIGEDIVMSVAGKAANALVRVDPGQFEQVVMNLVVNARDAMPQGGRLTVETTDASVDVGGVADNPGAAPGQYVVLSVSDTGTGMSPETRARIFEPYFTTKDVGKGTGLGLSTAYGIVRQSDGYISVTSELGLGATFRIFLPRAEAAPATSAGQAGDPLPGGTEHVLLVEDDPSVRRMSKELLTRLGYSVTEAASGRAGLALGSDDTRHFDLALCDVILGDMSGPAVAEALMALRPEISVLYMSGYSDEAIVRTGVLDEGKPFLQKPFTPTQLAKTIRALLDERREGT
jgi:signal transduction histidine kinase/CheY-like chemotaxis protein